MDCALGESPLIRSDYLVLSKLVFDWADSYDAKVGSHVCEKSLPD